MNEYSVLTRLKRAGATTTLNKMIFTRGALYSLISIITSVTIIMVYYLINSTYKNTMLLTITLIVFILQVVVTSMFIRHKV